MGIRFMQLGDEKAMEECGIRALRAFRESADDGEYPQRAFDRDLSFQKEEYFKVTLASKEHIPLVVDLEGTILGYALCSFPEWSGVLMLDFFCVRPEYQRNGVGSSLLEGVAALAKKQQCHKVFCEAHPCFKGAVSLLSKNGYRQEGRLPNHFNHLDLLLFGKIVE